MYVNVMYNRELRLTLWEELICHNYGTCTLNNSSDVKVTNVNIIKGLKTLDYANNILRNTILLM